MKTFITDNFLLHNETARELYHDHAAHEPILDFHCHLVPEEIAENRQYRNLYEIWIEADPYKWRAMRANGISERYITGDATEYEKYLAWARTVPRLLRNPLYHWVHLELKRFLGIDELLDEESAPRVWEAANERLASPEMRAVSILERLNVKAVCTTDDPTDTLEHHERFRQAPSAPFRMYPTYRPDLALAVDQPEVFNPWVARLEGLSGVGCAELGGFLEALRCRHDCFHSVGGRLSDHGLERCHAAPCTETEAAAVYREARKGQVPDAEAAEKYRTFMMVYFGRLDAEKGWTKQLHIGAIRSLNTRFLRSIGPNSGFDSIGDHRQAQPLATYLDLLDQTDQLPKMVLYNSNPADNYVFGTMVGNFQGGTIPGKIQFGSGWWHLDQKEGMEWQMNALSNLGLLSRFVGMVTDSRSLFSYSRHEYFRRILCNLIGQDVENGELPREMTLLGGLVRDICYRNAERYLGLEV